MTENNEPVVNPDFIAPDNMLKASPWIFVTFQKEGIHCWPDAVSMPGVEFLANPHRHMFHFREMLAAELAKYIIDHYPGRKLKIEISEDGENGAVVYYD